MSQFGKATLPEHKLVVNLIDCVNLPSGNDGANIIGPRNPDREKQNPDVSLVLRLQLLYLAIVRLSDLLQLQVREPIALEETQ